MFSRLMDILFELTRYQKRIVLLALDLFLIVSSYYFSLALVQNSFVIELESINSVHLLLSILLALFTLHIMGLYKTITRYISLKILMVIGFSSLLASASSISFGYFIDNANFSLASGIVYASFLCLTIGGQRLLVRAYFSSRFNTLKDKVIIYGAGASGQQLALSLANGAEFYPVAFVDDKKEIQNTYVQGIKVYPPSELTRLSNYFEPTKILLALPSLSKSLRKDIINKIEKIGVPIQTVPGIKDLVEGNMKIDEFQNVEIEDLLGRDPVPPVESLLTKNISNKVILVTGAGGSIGSELCRQIILLKPKKLILFDVSEFALYQIDKELSEKNASAKLNVVIKPILGTVLNKNKVSKVINYFGVQTVYHAAAYKHVPMVEHNVIEGVKNNIIGTLNVALSSEESGVESFVLISTDKAVRPTNVMGATKRFAELICQAIATNKSNTCFSMVRFGNVLGSSGSVIPAFKQQIKRGGPVTVTHPDIIRYFMTIPEAAQLVIQAGAMAKGGDVFVLDMGEPVKIVDLAKKLILLMGLEFKNVNNPSGDIEIVYSGLRPGEKLFEELLIGDNVEGTSHPRIMTANEKFVWWDEMLCLIDKLKTCCNADDIKGIRDVLLAAPADYQPSTDIQDFLSNDKVGVDTDYTNNKVINLKK